METTYPERILKLTGRTIEQALKRCLACDGLGFRQYEPVCETCAGVGETTEWVFSGCGHHVETDECDEDCFEACQVQVDLDVHCGRQVSQVFAEPFTPRAFELRCCDSCAENFMQQGYKIISCDQCGKDFIEENR